MILQRKGWLVDGVMSLLGLALTGSAGPPPTGSAGIPAGHRLSVPPVTDFSHRSFYLPAHLQYTLADSAIDSIRFTLTKTLRRDERGHLVSISSFVDPEGQVMSWHDFGNLEGPGWAANAVGGAYEIHLLGGLLNKSDWQSQAKDILDHVLEGGFIDEQTGFIRPYRETTTGKFCLNYKHHSDWFCPGSMAKIAFRTLLVVSKLLKDEAVRSFAYGNCLRGLDPFKMRENRNGVATRGLLCMEKSWDTAYLWENAEAALAYFEAAADTRAREPDRSREYEMDGLVILRAIAKHHHGPHGFLTEGVDWNNHVGQQHHVDQARFGDIRYTEPFLNNQRIAEPTVYYLLNLACRSTELGSIRWRDPEGNVILKTSIPAAPPNQPL